MWLQASTSNNAKGRQIMMRRYEIERAYRKACSLADKVEAFERAMEEAVVHGGLSYDEAFWYVSTITQEGR